MSKKRFTSGIDDLFNDDGPVQEMVAEQEYGRSEVVTLYRSSTDRKANTKNFVSDLDALLQDAMDESFEKYEARQAGNSNAMGKSKSSSASMPTANRAPLSGLDALIRQTIDVQEITTDEFSGKKRLTVAVEKPKLEKLKMIARMENSFLKDILVNLIDEYIAEYAQHKGVEI